MKPFIYSSKTLDIQLEVRGEQLFWCGREVSIEDINELEQSCFQARSKIHVNRTERKRLAEQESKR